MLFFGSDGLRILVMMPDEVLDDGGLRATWPVPAKRSILHTFYTLKSGAAER